MGVYTHSDGNWLSRRGGFLAVLIAFHILMFWALKSGFAIKIAKAITEPIKVEIIEEVKIEEPPPPPPTVQIEMPQIQVPPILVDIPNPPDPPPTALVIQTTPDPVPPAPPTPPPVVSGGTGKASPVVLKPTVRSKPDTADFYPTQSRSLQEEGLVKIRLCYDLKGKVNESTLSESSKFPKLDEAAVRMGKLFQIKPGSTDGKVEAGCVVIPVRFSLKGE
jgi:periplasmic protein TonB